MKEQRIRMKLAWTTACLVAGTAFLLGTAPSASADFKEIGDCGEITVLSIVHVDEGCYDVGTFATPELECTYEDHLIAIGGTATCGGASTGGLASGVPIADKSCTAKNPCVGFCDAALCIVEACTLTGCIQTTPPFDVHVE